MSKGWHGFDEKWLRDRLQRDTERTSSKLQERETRGQKEREAVPLHRPRSEGKDARIERKPLVFVVFELPDARRRDPDGMLATLFDELVRSGILTDDNHRDLSGFSVMWEITGRSAVTVMLLEENKNG